MYPDIHFEQKHIGQHFANISQIFVKYLDSPPITSGHSGRWGGGGSTVGRGAPGTPLLGRNSGMGAGIHIQRPAQCAHSKPPSSFLQPGLQPALSGAPATNINISVLFHPNRQPNTYLTFIAQQSHHHPPSSVQLLIRMYLCICVFAYLHRPCQSA